MNLDDLIRRLECGPIDLCTAQFAAKALADMRAKLAKYETWSTVAREIAENVGFPYAYASHIRCVSKDDIESMLKSYAKMATEAERQRQARALEDEAAAMREQRDTIITHGAFEKGGRKLTEQQRKEFAWERRVIAEKLDIEAAAIRARSAP
jgi:hypothetical protein